MKILVFLTLIITCSFLQACGSCTDCGPSPCPNGYITIDGYSSFTAHAGDTLSIVLVDAYSLRDTGILSSVIGFRSMDSITVDSSLYLNSKLWGDSTVLIPVTGTLSRRYRDTVISGSFRPSAFTDSVLQANISLQVIIVQGIVPNLPQSKYLMVNASPLIGTCISNSHGLYAVHIIP